MKGNIAADNEIIYISCERGIPGKKKTFLKATPLRNHYIYMCIDAS
jgi:hypothetical protein